MSASPGTPTDPKPAAQVGGPTGQGWLDPGPTAPTGGGLVVSTDLVVAVLVALALLTTAYVLWTLARIRNVRQELT